MNKTMKAVAQIIPTARALISEGTATCPECGKHLYQHTVTPDAETDALHQALDEYDDALRPATEQDWWNWFLAEDEDGPTRNQRTTRLMR